MKSIENRSLSTITSHFKKLDKNKIYVANCPFSITKKEKRDAKASKFLGVSI